MKKFSFGAAIAAVLLVSALLSGCGLITRTEYETNSHPIEEAFSEIEIDVSLSGVRILAADDGKCLVVCEECNKVKHSVKVENGKLTISDKWLEHSNVDPNKISVTVYLPEGEYGALSIENASGAINVADGFVFSAASLQNASGATTFCSDVKGNLLVDTASGAITLSGVHCQNADLDSASGAVELQGLIASGLVQIETASGGVRLQACDAGAFDIETASGSVTGTLLTGKLFDVDSMSGKVNVPSSSVGGICTIRTASGSVDISVE